jgi:hypothetical protein
MSYHFIAHIINIIGIFEIKSEDYEHLAECLGVLMAAVDQIKFLDIQGVRFEIEFKFGGDLKFLANIYGINQANSSLPCLWCKKNKDDFHAVRFCLFK